MWEAIGGFALVFTVRLCDVSLGTLRMLFTVRGRKWIAGTIGTIEVSIFLFALSHVVGAGADMAWAKFFGYCFGFGTGTVLGIRIEEWLAPGNVRVTIVSREMPDLVIRDLRNAGFGVTEADGRGKDGAVSILIVVTRRRDLPYLNDIVLNRDPDAFISTNEAHFIYRGYLHKIKRK